MKRFFIAVTLIFLLAPEVFAAEQSILARVTVYWASAAAVRIAGPGGTNAPRVRACGPAIAPSIRAGFLMAAK